MATSTALVLTFSVTGAAAAAAFWLRTVTRKRALAATASGSEQAFYVDPESGRSFPLDEPRWSGGKHDDGSPIPLMLSELPGITRDMIDTSKRSLWRYAAAFPINQVPPDYGNKERDYNCQTERQALFT